MGNDALREALTIGLRHANKEVKACELRYSEQYKTRCIDDVRKIEAALAGLPKEDAKAEMPSEFLDRYEAHMLNLLRLDPRERGMQAAYSSTMTVLYGMREMLTKQDAAPQPYNQFGTDY